MSDSTEDPTGTVWDKVLTSPIRYAIMSALKESDRVSYTTFLEALRISKSLLSKHLSVLEKAGYIRIHKIERGYAVSTELEKTSLGAERFDNHREMMLNIGRVIVDRE